MTAVRENKIQEFIKRSERFLAFLREWEGAWPVRSLDSLIHDAGGPENVAIICLDLLRCFTSIGRLASPRVASIINPIVDLFKLAHDSGIHNFILPQEDHPEDSPQFRAYGPHCISGSFEAQTVPELQELPFSEEFKIILKRSINPGIGTQLVDWIDEHPNIKRFILVGDCTDLCVYQTATYLRLRANQFNLDYEVFVPENCVDTFDILPEIAIREGILPHDAELLNLLFLYHMALNDIKVVKEFSA